MPRRSRRKEGPPEPSGPIARMTRIPIEAVVIGALMLGLFHWIYPTAPLPATLIAIVALLVALAIDYFWFESRRARKA